jgi:hypothetical protein
MANYELSGPIAYLKNHFREFVQDDFLNAKDAENGFEWHLDSWKNLFIDITKVFFETSRLWVLRVIRILQTSLPRIRPIRFSRRPGHRKSVCMAFRHLENSFHRSQQRRILRRPEDRWCILIAIRLFKTSLPQLRPIRFFDAQDSNCHIAWRYNTMKNRFIECAIVSF